MSKKDQPFERKPGYRPRLSFHRSQTEIQDEKRFVEEKMRYGLHGLLPHRDVYTMIAKGLPVGQGTEEERKEKIKPGHVVRLIGLDHEPEDDLWLIKEVESFGGGEFDPPYIMSVTPHESYHMSQEELDKIDAAVNSPGTSEHYLPGVDDPIDVIEPFVDKWFSTDLYYSSFLPVAKEVVKKRKARTRSWVCARGSKCLKELDESSVGAMYNRKYAWIIISHLAYAELTDTGVLLYQSEGVRLEAPSIDDTHFSIWTPRELFSDPMVDFKIMQYVNRHKKLCLYDLFLEFAPSAGFDPETFYNS